MTPALAAVTSIEDGKGSPRIVVAGTGTGVGKSFLSLQLLRALNQLKPGVLGLKPIETGFTDPANSDAGLLANAAGHALVTPYFTSPIPQSPHRVARLAGVDLNGKQVRSWVDTQVELCAPWVHVVELAGGLFTPISETETNLDVVRALEPCRFVLVVHDRLGALHDALCAISAARAGHRSPDAVCLNLQDPAAEDLENAVELSRQRGVPAIYRTPLNQFASAQALIVHLLRLAMPLDACPAQSPQW